MGRFTSIIEFDYCENCPFKVYVDDDYSPIHTECEKTGSYIEKWTNSIGYKNYRNEEMVLDNCPFLSNNVIKEEE